MYNTYPLDFEYLNEFYAKTFDSLGFKIKQKILKIYEKLIKGIEK